MRPDGEVGTGESGCLSRREPDVRGWWWPVVVVVVGAGWADVATDDVMS